MDENTREKSLMKVKENSIFYKIKNFFRNLFYKKKNIQNVAVVEQNNNSQMKEENNKSSFKEYIKNIENEETILLKLQKQYRSGEIKEEDLTQEQVKSLCALYEKQIATLKKSNEMRKQRILEYKRKLQTDN